MELDLLIEAVLYFKGEPISFKKLAGFLKSTEQEVIEAVLKLKTRLENNKSGLVILTKDDEVALGTSPLASDLIKDITKEELQKDLGRAGLETLSTIVYHGPISKSRIDYIRGVNSGFIVRNLMIRGLIERTVDPKDSRSYLYKPTFELLSYLGISKIEEMPEYGELNLELEKATNNLDNLEQKTNNKEL